MKTSAEVAMDRFNDLNRQGFMRAALAPEKVRKAKPAAKIITCDDCRDWHYEGRHTADAATRRVNRKAAAQSKAKYETDRHAWRLEDPDNFLIRIAQYLSRQYPDGMKVIRAAQR